jgi:hypothetical protein
MLSPSLSPLSQLMHMHAGLCLSMGVWLIYAFVTVLNFLANTEQFYVEKFWNYGALSNYMRLTVDVGIYGCLFLLGRQGLHSWSRGLLSNSSSSSNHCQCDHQWKSFWSAYCGNWWSASVLHLWKVPQWTRKVTTLLLLNWWDVQYTASNKILWLLLVCHAVWFTFILGPSCPTSKRCNTFFFLFLLRSLLFRLA